MAEFERTTFLRGDEVMSKIGETLERLGVPSERLETPSSGATR